MEVINWFNLFGFFLMITGVILTYFLLGREKTFNEIVDDSYLKALIIFVLLFVILGSGIVLILW